MKEQKHYNCHQKDGYDQVVCNSISCLKCKLRSIVGYDDLHAIRFIFLFNSGNLCAQFLAYSDSIRLALLFDADPDPFLPIETTDGALILCPIHDVGNIAYANRAAVG